MATILAAVQFACAPATEPDTVNNNNTAEDMGTRADAGAQNSQDTGPAADSGSDPDAGVDAGNNAPDAGPTDNGVAADAGCTPQCANRECGDDGCGGSCGTCADSTCDEVSGMCIAPSLCPPTGPFGTREGDIMQNAPFEDCEGVPYSLHDVCQARVSWAFILAGW